METEREDECDPLTQLSKRSRVIPQIISASRYDNVGHLPAHSEPKQRCKVLRPSEVPKMQLSLVCYKRKELLSGLSLSVTRRTHSSSDDLSFITSVLCYNLRFYRHPHCLPIVGNHRGLLFLN